MRTTQTEFGHMGSMAIHVDQEMYISGTRGYKTFSAVHEILNALKYKNIKKFGFVLAQISLECYFPRS